MNMLVLARKYNDIFYAISTSEWEQSEKHYLMMITDRLDRADYPMQEMFDGVFTIHTQSSTMAFLREIWSIKKILRKINYSVVTTSNLAMVENLYVLNYDKTRVLVMLEDGIMNYYNFRPSHRTSKMFVMKVLGINEQRIQNKIDKCYLLKPSEAKYYFGKPTKLDLKSNIFLEKANLDSSVKGKSIFVGQDLYRDQNITLKEYSKIVNDFITEKQIDFYIPHTWSLEGENINCKQLDIIGSKATLEIYASVFDFTIYSFSSSVLYTTKIINPHVKSIALKHPKIKGLNSDNIIYKLVDNTINIE